MNIDRLAAILKRAAKQEIMPRAELVALVRQLAESRALT